MSKRRGVLLSVLIGLVLVGGLLTLAFRHAAGDYSARAELDHLLGQAQLGPDWPDIGGTATPEQLPAMPYASAGSGNSGSPGSFFGLPLPMPQAGVDVQEMPESYVLRIPLADPNDASSIKLSVTSNRIEVSGQTGSRENGISTTSSFMQAFTTSQELLPSQITRRTEQNGERTEMVITIPKKQTGGLGDENFQGAADTRSGQPHDSTTDLPQIAPNPLDNVINKVF